MHDGICSATTTSSRPIMAITKVASRAAFMAGQVLTTVAQKASTAAAHAAPHLSTRCSSTVNLSRNANLSGHLAKLGQDVGSECRKLAMDFTGNAASDLAAKVSGKDVNTQPSGRGVVYQATKTVATAAFNQKLQQFKHLTEQQLKDLKKPS